MFKEGGEVVVEVKVYPGKPSDVGGLITNGNPHVVS